MNKRCLVAAGIVLSANSITNTSMASELNTVVITGSRVAETTDTTLASITVITQDDIQRQQSQSVQDVLKGLAGVTVTNNGGAGKASSVFLRGTESDHVLVLIDGIKVGSATLGTTAFEHIPVEQIERIEIVHGPMSSLYGSEAIGGVIQIFTLKGGQGTRPFFSIGGGRYNSYNASLGVSGGGDNGWFSISASGSDTEGFNSCTGKPSPDGAGCFTDEPDEDGYRNIAGNIRAGYRFESGLELDAHALQSSGESEFDSSLANESDTAQQVYGGSARFSPLQTWTTSLTAGRSLDKSDNFNNSNFQSRFESQRDTVSLQNDITLHQNHLVVLGADYQNDEVESTTAFDVTSRDNTGVFAQYRGTNVAQSLQISVRQDDNEQFGDNNSGNIAWSYAFDHGVKLKASYGTAFKAPTFNELYFPGFGNANLLPEESRSIELGLSGRAIWGQWSSHLFETEIDQLIAYDASIFAPANIEEVRIRGLETTFNSQIRDWSFALHLTLLDPENLSSGANNGNELPRRASESLRFDISHQLNQLTLGSTLVMEGQRYDDVANTQELNGYATLDLRAELHIAADWLLQARVENIFDKAYETASYYQQPGRGLYVTLRYQPSSKAED